ncbi:MAG: hypothetical protein KY432_06470 [Acidobacteria bacterium]|nr:hypothetical protein [Acidobacteriota bacterium]
MRNISVVALLFLGFSAVAAADSDGYFCVGRGYLAYETHASETSDAHQLHVVQYFAADGIIHLPPITLEDFQVHGMNCHSTGIELHGWTTIYSVDITDPTQPIISSRPGSVEDERPPPAENLGHWAKEQVINLEAEDAAPGEFQLVISRISRGVEGGSEHYTFSELIHRAQPPWLTSITQSSRLFTGIFLETAD